MQDASKHSSDSSHQVEKSRVSKTLDATRNLWSKASRARESKTEDGSLAKANNLLNQARSYKGQGKYSDAEPLFMRALDIYKMKKNHYETVPVLYELASLYTMQNKHSDAEQSYKHASTLYEEMLGSEHRSTADSLYHLGQCYYKQNKYREAEQSYKRALDIYENHKDIGPEHSLTAMCLYQLGNCHQNQGNYRDAEPWYQRVSTFYEKKLGSEHRSTAESLYQLGQCYYNQNKYREAEQSYKRALDIYEKDKDIGPEHSLTVMCLYQLGNCHQNQGKYSDAEPLFMRGLAICEKHYPGSPIIPIYLRSLAQCYYNQSNYKDAAKFQMRAFEIYEQMAQQKNNQIAMEKQQEHTQTREQLTKTEQEHARLQRQPQEAQKALDQTQSELIKTQQKQQEQVSKTQQNQQDQTTNTQQEITLAKQEIARLQRQLQEIQESLEQAQNEKKENTRNSQPDRQIGTSSRSTDKEEVSTSKPPVPSEPNYQRPKPLVLRTPDDQHGKPLVLRTQDDHHDKPLVLRTPDDQHGKPLVLSEKDTKPQARVETKAARRLDSASTSVRDVNKPLRINCALGEYITTDILSDETDYIIYLAEPASLSYNEQEDHQKLVFKVPQPYMRKNLDNFTREAEILEMFKGHPNIVAYQDFQDFNEDGTPPFLAMDFAQGGTLLDAHPLHERLDLELILHYVKQIAPILDDIHKQNVIHLDIKPANIFLKKESEHLKRELLIGDFGCARFVESEPLQLAPEEIIGTTEYIAPEYLKCCPTYASDLYPVAIMVYEWLSGHCPFESNYSNPEHRKHDIQFQLLNNSPARLYDRVPGVTRAIEKVIFKALAKDPKDRYHNVTAFAEALEQAYRLREYPEWISSLFDDQLPQTAIAKWIDSIYQPQKRFVLHSRIFQWTGWHLITNESSQTTLFQDIGQVKTYLVGSAKYYLRRIAQLSRSAKELEQIQRPEPLPGDDYYFKERYAATTVQWRSDIYTIGHPMGCVVDATQMLLHDQGISIEDEEIAKKLEYDVEKGTYTGKIPDVLKKLGSKELKHDTRERGYTETMPAALKKLGSIKYKFMKDADIQDLKDALKSSYAIVATIRGRDKMGMHVVVIDKIGKDNHGNGPFVYIRDGRYDKPYKVTIDEWEKVWWNGECVIPDIS
jgi:serine/threonine protein kinase/tetratricopeptide (TPR) repeat protein